MRYKTALDFRRALTHRHNEQARKTGTGVNDLHKRVAFERFLARLFQTGDERWVLKGGYALELRLGGKARATVDIDLNVPPPPEDDLLEVLRTAADHDLGDFFRFAITPSPQPLKGPPMGGSRFMVDAILADKTFVKFAIDVGQGDVLLNPVEWLDGQVNLEFAGLPAVKFPSYPLADHFAEKLHAYTKPRAHPTRIKDLIDMALILGLGLEPGAGLAVVIRATFARYDTHPLPEVLPVPPDAWAEPFEKMAQGVDLQPSNMVNWHERLRVFLMRSLNP
jgi:Nucleotidyl transferase AbiEii toxin, Type IV TA system